MRFNRQRVLLLFIKLFYRNRQANKIINYNLLFMIFLLLFCGIVVDMAHSTLPNVSGLTTLEDGGEMFVMSLIFWYLFMSLKNHPKINFSFINIPALKFADFLFDYIFKLFKKLHFI